MRKHTQNLVTVTFCYQEQADAFHLLAAGVQSLITVTLMRNKSGDVLREAALFARKTRRVSFICFRCLSTLRQTFLDHDSGSLSFPMQFITCLLWTARGAPQPTALVPWVTPGHRIWLQWLADASGCENGDAKFGSNPSSWKCCVLRVFGAPMFENGALADAKRTVSLLPDKTPTT